MRKIFPVTARAHRMLGVIKLIVEHSGSADISVLSNETNEDIDSLLPLIDACRMLGLCIVKNGTVSIGDAAVTGSPKELNAHIAKRLRRIEPFRSVLAMLGNGKVLTTRQIADRIERLGMVLYSPRAANEIGALKELLAGWAVHTKLLKHNAGNDSWSLA